jgi:hypothetical protein
VLLAELRALVQDPAQLGQLPVFMAHLGAAVKQQRSRYPVYALFRQVQVPRDLHDYVWRRHRVPTVEQLQKYLVRGGVVRVLICMWHVICCLHLYTAYMPDWDDL